MYSEQKSEATGLIPGLCSSPPPAGRPQHLSADTITVSCTFSLLQQTMSSLSGENAPYLSYCPWNLTQYQAINAQ